jgi:hypothetical protein
VIFDAFRRALADEQAAASHEADDRIVHVVAGRGSRCVDHAAER